VSLRNSDRKQNRTVIGSRTEHLFSTIQIERLEAKPEVPEAELAEARTQAEAAKPLYEQVCNTP
jgi:hypothetical protein